MRLRVEVFILTLFFLVFADQVFAQSFIENTLPEDYPVKVFSDFQKDEITSASIAFMGLPKLYFSGTVLLEDSLDRWPAGSWGRGYQSWPGFLANPGLWLGKTDGYYKASHPLVRDVSVFLRGHLQLYLGGHDTGHVVILKNGIDYLLSEQVVVGPSAGAWRWWKKRNSQYSTAHTTADNPAITYETSYALAALCEYYHAGIDYRRPDVLSAIQLATGYMTKQRWSADANNNANIRALGLWSLSQVYSITADTEVYKKMKVLARWLIKKQQKKNNDLSGTWQTGGREDIGEPYSQGFHDTKIAYHMFILRGLIEAFGAVPESDVSFKQDIADAIKRAVNHVLIHRIDHSSVTAYQLRYLYTDDEGQLIPWFVYEPLDLEIYFEALVKLSFFAQHSSYFLKPEYMTLRKLTNKLAGGLDATNKWHLCAIGYYTHYTMVMDNGLPGSELWKVP
jgi:hypothetical protein